MLLKKSSPQLIKPNKSTFPCHPGRDAVNRVLFCLVLALYFGLSPIPLRAGPGLQSQATGLVTQEFRYKLPEAGEVYLVWGIDGWQLVPEETRPAGTLVEYGVMHTPMKQEGDTFIARVQIPAGATLDYGFQTRKKSDGTAIEWLWEGDYQLTASSDNVLEVTAAISLEQAKAFENGIDAPQVTQELQYYLPEAGEVYLVWGINGWQMLPEEVRPVGTMVEYGLMHTPMTLEDGAYVARIQLPAGTILDYGFQARKKNDGTSIEWSWQGDYQVTPSTDGVIEITGAVSLAQAKGHIVDFESGLYLFSGVLLLFGLVLILWRLMGLAEGRETLRPVVTLLGASLSLYFFLLVLRAHILGFDPTSLRHYLNFLPRLLVAGYYDLIYVGVITSLFLGLLLLSRKYLKVQRVLIFAYYIISLFSLFMAFVNIQAIKMLERPINYQWFYYADFLTGADGQNAVLANVSSSVLLNLVTLSLAMIIGARLLLKLINLLPKPPSNRSVFVATVVPLFVYLPMAYWYIDSDVKNYAKLANPIIAFVDSVVEAGLKPGIFTMELDETFFAEFRGAGGKPLEKLSNQSQAEPKIQNVIIFVLESVPAEYIEAYGGSYPVTPELNSYRPYSLLFKNIYAHAPASNQSLFAILSGMYPLISYASLTQVNPEVDTPTLSSELKKYGYRTAFLSAGETSFQRGDEFLAHRQFDLIEDYKTIACERQRIDLEWAHSDGIDEECLIETFDQWQSEKPDQPFFAMMWTVGTHYPYFVIGEEVNYGVSDKSLNRYLNALHHSDQALGRLLRTLEERDLLDSTLVVVVGDHGEAFGRHNQITHASKIYEENLHVPFILINPGLFQGEENSIIGGHVDVAPTLMHLLDLPAPAAWQGQSLFSPDRSGRTYFFAPWSDFLFGYREGDLKFIYNATTDSNELYDLATDPYETTNLIDQRPELVPLAHQRLAAWVQYQDKFMKELLSPKDR